MNLIPKNFEEIKKVLLSMGFELKNGSFVNSDGRHFSSEHDIKTFLHGQRKFNCGKIHNKWHGCYNGIWYEDVVIGKCYPETFFVFLKDKLDKVLED